MPAQNTLQQALAPQASCTSCTQLQLQPAEDSKYITIKSPIIGTFYRKPSPDKPMFVEVGTYYW